MKTLIYIHFCGDVYMIVLTFIQIWLGILIVALLMPLCEINASYEKLTACVEVPNWKTYLKLPDTFTEQKSLLGLEILSLM